MATPPHRSPTLRAVRPQLRLLLPAASGILAIVLVLVIVLGGGGGSSRSSTGFDGAIFPTSLRAYDFKLPNQQGRSVSLSAHRGQVVTLAFLSSTCRVCMLVAQQVRGALDELGAPAGVHTIFVSTDPRSDTSERVGRFLNETSLTGRVEYLTGTPAQLRTVWHAYGVAPASAGKKASEAATIVLLIDRSGTERVGFGLEQITPEGLAHDIRLLQAG